MGDVAGVGPEVIVRACSDRRVRDWCRPLVVGHPQVLRRAADLIQPGVKIVPLKTLDDLEHPHDVIPCWNPADDEAAAVAPGVLDRRAGRAAFDYLVAATHAAIDGRVDAVTTAPLNKAALHSAGLPYPGHTEILAEVCGVEKFAMMLYLPSGPFIPSPHGLGVAHVTLHTSIRSVPGLLSPAAVQGTIELLARFMGGVGCREPRIAVCALNPHAGENGLFGDEEQRVISPAVSAASASGIDTTGPLPADTLLKRAVAGEFDGVAAMYHDQGHIALKLIGFDRAVNVTLGLPIIRTSPSHGTAFDIAWSGKAQADGMLEALRVASLLAQHRREHSPPSPQPNLKSEA